MRPTSGAMPRFGKRPWYVFRREVALETDVAGPA
jgi:hypothetical protein